MKQMLIVGVVLLLLISGCDAMFPDGEKTGKSAPLLPGEAKSDEPPPALPDGSSGPPAPPSAPGAP